MTIRISVKSSVYITVWVLLSACASGPARHNGLAGLIDPLPSSQLREQKDILKPLDIKPVLISSVDTFDVSAMMERAHVAYRQEDYTLSAKYYQQVWIRQPENIKARIGLGNAALALGQGGVAYELFSNIDLQTLSEPQRTQLFSGWVLSEIMTRQTVDTEVRLNAALERTQDDPRLWNALGHELDKQDRWDAAQNSYVNALATGRAHSAIVNNIGMSLLLQDRRQAALEKFEQALIMNPRQTRYDNNRRLTLALMERYPEALRSIDDKRAAQIFNDAGYIAMQQKKYALARGLLTQAVNLSPKYHVKAKANLDRLASLASSHSSP